MLKLAVAQFTPEHSLKESNEKRLLDGMNSIKADIIVYPELSTTGYYFIDKSELTKISEPADGAFYHKVQTIASRDSKIIVYGFSESDGDKLFNSARIVFPDAEMSCVYRKTHLFYNEFKVFEPGDTGFFVIEDESRDLRLGTMICYDWRFPEAARTLGLLGADLIVCPANLVTDAWHKVMPARAIENKVYLAVSNRSGREEFAEENLIFKGKSAIHSFDGNVISEASAEGDTVLLAEIDPSATRDKSFNPVNDIFDDRRPEMYLKD